MRGDHARERAQDGARSAVQEVHAEHGKGEVGRRDRDDAVEVDSTEEDISKEENRVLKRDPLVRGMRLRPLRHERAR